MRLLLTVLLALLLANTAMAQTSQVQFYWTQVDSTLGTLMPDGSRCCKRAIEDGGLAKYEIFIATPTDTSYWGFVEAPYAIADTVIALVPFEMYVSSSIAVRAVDIRDKTGPLSLWSVPFTVDPGEPAAPPQPTPIRVYFGG